MAISKRIRDYMITDSEQYSDSVITVSEHGKYFIMMTYSIIFIFSSFIFNSPSEIADGMIKIIMSPSILLTDYVELANLGSAFFNSGLLMLSAIIIVKVNKLNISGPVIAGIFIVFGFGFFGKNVYNVWPIIIGAYIYSKFQGDSFDKYIVLTLFGTSLGPIVSQISFGFEINAILGILLGIISGLAVGVIMIPLANHFVSFHQGFNLYNMGFTAGIIATILMSIFRSFGLDNINPNIISNGNNYLLSLYFSLIFLSMILIGYFLNNNSFKSYKKLLKSSGRLISDFVTIYGFGISMINIGLLGIVSIVYVLLIQGELSGIVVGGIITVAGFGAFGKHIRNIIPIIIGVYIASLFNIWNADQVSYIIAALFGTALAPIAGKYGWKIGILAGFLHAAVVMNVGYLHGGMNLYNNGFSCGIVAAVMIPLLENFGKEKA